MEIINAPLLSIYYLMLLAEGKYCREVVTNYFTARI
jgi:hypothetical protein